MKQLAARISHTVAQDAGPVNALLGVRDVAKHPEPVSNEVERGRCSCRKNEGCGSDCESLREEIWLHAGEPDALEECEQGATRLGEVCREEVRQSGLDPIDADQRYSDELDDLREQAGGTLQRTSRFG